MRMIIDGNVKTEPRTWKITKVNRISPNGISNVTLAQDHYDEHLDYIEYDSNGNIVGMWADYYSKPVTPVDAEKEIKPTSDYAEIAYTGYNPEIKVGGGYKKFTVNFFDKDGNPIPWRTGTWKFTIDNVDASSLVNTTLDNNIIKIKFLGGREYIDKVLSLEYESSDGIKTSLDISIIAL